MRIGKIFALPARSCIDYELNGNPIRQVDRFCRKFWVASI